MIETSGKKLAGSIIRLHPNDNIVVARVDIAIGTEVPSEHFTSRSQVPVFFCRLVERFLSRDQAALVLKVILR